MRTIKFRTYSESKKDWVYFNGIYNMPDPDYVGDDYQFTGLLDKNGKEIYDGDIISRGGNIFTVHFGKCAFGLSRVDTNGSFASSFEFNYEGNETGEIIGNIYENPDLLSNN